MDNQIKKNGVDGACGLYRKQEMCIQGLVRSPEGKRLLRRPRLAHGRIVLKRIFKKWDREAWTGL
jgi:hypothetical protein